MLWPHRGCSRLSAVLQQRRAAARDHAAAIAWRQKILRPARRRLIGNDTPKNFFTFGLKQFRQPDKGATRCAGPDSCWSGVFRGCRPPARASLRWPTYRPPIPPLTTPPSSRNSPQTSTWSTGSMDTLYVHCSEGRVRKPRVEHAFGQGMGSRSHASSRLHAYVWSFRRLRARAKGSFG